MNTVFFVLITFSFICAIFQNNMHVLSKAIIDSSKDAVNMCFELIGIMSFFLGIMKIAEKGGLLKVISSFIRPVMIKLFPDIPPDHPAIASMTMNISANMLGLGNAATPFGIRAMKDLNDLNPHPGKATDSMALFLAINTSNVTILPTGVIALRISAGSKDPAGIIPTTLFATTCSTAVAIISAKLLERIFRDEERITVYSESYPFWKTLPQIFLFLSLIPFSILFGKDISEWIIPAIVVFFLFYGIIKGVRIYETFIEGAKEGFSVAINIIPYLVAIFVAVGMFQASGAMDLMKSLFGRFTEKIGLPAEAIPMAILRPLSGSGSFAYLASMLKKVNPDSYTGYLLSTMQGSTETTFYVIAVYFGSVKIKKIRHTLIASLLADITAVFASVFICSFLYRRC